MNRERNIITVNITLEYDDGRNLEDRATYPIDERFIRSLILTLGPYNIESFSELKKCIYIHETNPLSEEQIKIGESMAKISRVLEESERYDSCDENERLHTELENWNWLQDCG